MRNSLLTCFVLMSLLAYGQNVAIKKIELAGEKVILHYDLDDASTNHEYLLSLYSSKDNYAAPLTKVKGDIGPEIKPGLDRKVELNLRQEFGPFKGRIAFEIRGKVFVPFVKVTNFDTEKSYKRGNTYDIAWKAGGTNAIHIELYKGSQRVTGELNHPNNGAFSMTFPSSASSGKDYRIKITDSKNPEEIVYTGYFKVVPKIPLALKILPIAVVVAAVAVLTGGSKSSSSGGTTDTGPQAIADPPLPGGE